MSDYIIGLKSIAKVAKDKKLSRIVVASNCPKELIDKVTSASKSVKVEKFDGDQRKLGTSIGKPFPVAMIGYLKND